MAKTTPSSEIKPLFLYQNLPFKDIVIQKWQGQIGLSLPEMKGM
jgi:hypothetical protein